MSPAAALTLLAVMAALAAVPSTSVALVVTRSATAGFRNGATAAAGIVAGDLVFVVLALMGLAALAETMGTWFIIVRHLGGVWLIWMGWSLWRARSRPGTFVQTDATGPASLSTSFMAGLIITLGDIKAILFYASLLPALVDIESLTRSGAILIALITIVTVGGVKLAYAGLASRILARVQAGRTPENAKLVGGALMLGSGVRLVLDS